MSSIPPTRGRLMAFIGPDRAAVLGVAYRQTARAPVADVGAAAYPTEVRQIVEGLRAEAARGLGPFVITTNNPLVLDELQPDEVTLVTVHPGRVVRRTLMTDTIDFERRRPGWTLGQLWLKFCRGGEEPDLVPPT